MGLLTGLIRDRLSELAIAPEEIAARRKRWEREMYSPGSGGAVLTYTPMAPNAAQNAPNQQPGNASAAPGTGNAAPGRSAAASQMRGPTAPAHYGTPGQATTDDPRGMIPVIRAAAARYGHDPEVAVRVARSEGLLNYTGDKGTSFGSFQLHTGGGLGDHFHKETGLDPRDPNNEPAMIDFSMRHLNTTGWSPYHGAAKVGVDQRAGIGVSQPQPTSTASTTSPSASPTTTSSSNATGASLNRYATGNARLGGPSSVEGVHPEFANRINNMVQAMPPDIAAKFNIISGHRSPERQSQVNPGVTNSHHAPGLAVDTTWDSGVRNWITQNGSRFGVGYTLAHMPNEGNHLEPTENGQRVQPSQMKQWAQTHMPTTSSSTQVAGSGNTGSTGSGGIGSAISGALSSIGNAIMPSAHADTLPQPPTTGAPATANQQTAAPPPPSTQSSPPQQPPPQQPPPQPPIATAQPVTSSQQMASDVPPDKIPQVEGLVRPAIYLMRRAK